MKGEVYRLKNPDLIFEKLDHYEGYYPADPENSLYLREQRTVRSATEPDNTFNAWIYLYNKPTTHLTLISSGDYLSFLEEE
ncbi:MAG: gamma-glutamylcyclotransferase family protein [Balneolaceae bacterium]|nr:gamma-glutamylcyclotransferase family protein [Balneolaceae bacterium]